MKFLFVVSICVLSFLSCKKKETCVDGILNQDEVLIDCGGTCGFCPIDYPEEDPTGLSNILYPTLLNLEADVDYSLTAELPQETSFKCRLVKLSSTGVWYFSDEVGWISNDYTGSQTFTATSNGIANLSIHFAEEGSARLEFYENDDDQINFPTFEKTIFWE